MLPETLLPKRNGILGNENIAHQVTRRMMVLETIYPMDFKLQPGDKLVHPQELTFIGQRGYQAQIAALWLEKQRGWPEHRTKAIT